MSNYSIKIPDIGEGITEVELVEWFVAKGDVVKEDQNVASVMTEKVAVDITSPVNGTVSFLGGQAGDILPVGADLVQIALSNPNVIDDNKEQQQVTPLALATALNTDETVADPTQKPKPLEKIKSIEKPAVNTLHERLMQKTQASPAVRKRAADLSIDLSTVAKKLNKDQLTHADLDQYLTKNVDLHTTESAVIESIPIRGLRRQIAKKMLESSQTIPHFSYVEAVDVTELENWRQQLNQQWASTKGHLTLLPFLIRALCLAITEHPHINARYNAQQESLEQYKEVHIAVATQTPEGLMVPVLKSAQCLGFWQIADQIRQLAQDAHAGVGALGTKSTITLSSLGPLGGVVATPIINTPEVAIVGINRQIQQPVVIDGQVEIRTMMNLSSSFDHRFIDGLHAAEFIQSLRRILESPHVHFVN